MLLKSFYITVLTILVAGPALASGDDVLDPIHHVADAYYIDVEPFGKIELPRLFIVRRDDGSLGFDVFRSTSSAVLNGHYRIESEGLEGPDSDAAQVEGHSPAADEHAAATDALDAHLIPAGGHVIADFSISRHLVFAWIGMMLVLVTFGWLARRYKRGIGRESAPRGVAQNMLETLIVFVRDEIARPNLGNKADRYLPYLLTAFFFILTCNLLGLVPFGATATSNISITAVLAFFTFVATQTGGTKDYWLHILWPPGIPVFVKFILVPVELLGIFTKPFALAIRLFANMTAGHLVILSLIGLIFTFSNLFGSGAGYGVAPVSIAFALFIYMLELLVALIQAYIFTMLSALFIGMAVEEHEHHEEHDHHPELAEHRVHEYEVSSGNGAAVVPSREGVAVAG